MDPVTNDLVSALSSSLNSATEAVKDAYKVAKQVIQRNLGISKALEDLEAQPDSKKNQSRLAEHLTAKNAAADPELIAALHQLTEAIKGAESSRESSSRYNINASGAQVGLVGDGIHIEGGVHFHGHANPSGADNHGPSSLESPGKQADGDESVLMHILHLSDLHFGTHQDARRWHSQLAADLKNELGCNKVDAIIISGDVANFAVEEEYEAARVFVELVCKEFGVERSNLVVVPGNHDLNWKLSKKGYLLKEKEDLSEGYNPEDVIPVCKETSARDPRYEVVRLRDDRTYQDRFIPFSNFYRDIKGEPFPLEYDRQGVIHHLKKRGLLILGLNSAWRIDHLFTGRAGICPDAIANVLNTVRQDPELENCLKFAVWHHPLNSPFADRITDQAFMELLVQSGFSVCFHGHLHKTTSELFRYDHSSDGRKIEIVGAGTFGAPSKEWYPGYPLQYNLLKIYKQRIIVKTRCRTEINGAWKPHAIWQQGRGRDPSSSYAIDLPRDAKRKHFEEKTAHETIAKKGDNIDPTLEANIQYYCIRARQLHEKLELKGFRTKLRVPIRIEDIYIALRAMVDRRATGTACFADSEEAECRLREYGGDEISVPEAFHVAEGLKRRGIVILGDPGSGKTTHLKRVLLWCLHEGLERLGLPTGMIPVFLPLRDLNNLKAGLDAFIQAQLDHPHLATPEGFGQALLNRGNLLFLFDGLDEVSDPRQRLKVSKWIDDALRIHRTCRFVITCRFAGYTEKARLSEEFLEMHMRPLTPDQAEEFIRTWYRIVETGHSSDTDQARLIAKERAGSLIERLKEPDFRSMRVATMTRNPLLLANLCLIHRDRGHLPKRRSRLYAECIDVLLELWHDVIGFKSKVDAETGRRVLQPAAYWLHQKKERMRATAEELEPVIEPVLTFAGWPSGSALDFLRTVRDESGLLTGWSQDQFGFMHLGFQEYLTAIEIKNRAYHDPTVLENLAQHFGEGWWQEVTLLLLAQENPCLFENFMTEVIRRPTFMAHSDLMDKCLEESAEISIRPFVDLVQTAGKDSGLWERQFAVLRIIEQMDKAAIENMAEVLRKHPDDRIRKWIRERSKAFAQKVIRPEPSGYELVFIPGGTFMMGSPETEKGRYSNEGPMREVTIPDFHMGRYPVTNEEYKRYLEANPNIQEPRFWADRQFNQPRQPVVGVNWYEAKKFAEWSGLQLPSEAQWEYACRAGTTTRYYNGDAEADLARAGWYEQNSGDKPHAVGEKEPNAFGLYDMHGNVWEWCEDCYHNRYDGAPVDGSSRVDRNERGQVLRGGSWFVDAGYCRTAFRYWFVPDSRGGGFGFRLVRLPGQPGEPGQ